MHGRTPAAPAHGSRDSTNRRSRGSPSAVASRAHTCVAHRLLALSGQNGTSTAGNPATQQRRSSRMPIHAGTARRRDLRRHHMPCAGAAIQSSLRSERPGVEVDDTVVIGAPVGGRRSGKQAEYLRRQPAYLARKRAGGRTLLQRPVAQTIGGRLAQPVVFAPVERDRAEAGREYRRGSKHHGNSSVQAMTACIEPTRETASAG